MSGRTSATAALLGALALAGCTASSGNLYFLSAQRVGVEVAASDPASNAAPKILIGYESVKGAVNPVKDEDGGLRDQAYSVLGITGVSTAGSEDVGLAVSEWFATGLAAELLARNELTPIALAGARTLTPEVLAKASVEQVARTYDAIAGARVWLADMEPTPRRQTLLAALDGLAPLVDGLDFMEFDAAGARQQYALPTSTGFDRVEEAHGDLEISIGNARTMRDDTNASPADRQRAADAAAALEGVLSGFERAVLDSDAARAVWNELVDIIDAGGA